MKKTAKRVSAPKKRGLLVFLALMFTIAPHNPALAQTFDFPQEISLATVPVVIPEEPVAPPTIQETLLSVCESRGYGEDCAKMLLGMAWKESQFKADAIGDHGRARGWFQIWYKLHGITIEQAEDLTFSANWTLDYLESNQYPKYVRWAVQCHNGCGLTNYRYADSALYNGNRLWNSDSAQIALAN